MIKVAVALPPAVGDPGEFLADVRALEAAGADTVFLQPGGPRDWVLLGALGALTERISLRPAGIGDDLIDVLQKVTGGRVVTADPADEKWLHIEMPPDRSSWTAMLREHEEAGVNGVIVPWDPRLIDLLRNPGEDDRSDLLMSTG